MHSHDELYMFSLECYVSVYFVINTELTLSWAQKQYSAHTLSYTYL